MHQIVLIKFKRKQYFFIQMSGLQKKRWIIQDYVVFNLKVNFLQFNSLKISFLLGAKNTF